MLAKNQVRFMIIRVVVGIGMSLNTYAQPSVPRMLTFDKAYEHMMSHSHVLKQADYQISEKEAQVKVTAGLRAPKISLTGIAAQLSDPLHLDLTPVRDAIDPLYSALGNYGVFSGVPNPDPATNSLMPVLPDDISTAAVRRQLLEGQQAIQAADWDKMIQEERFASLSANLTWPLFTGGRINAANEASRIYKEEAGLQKEQKQAELLSELVTRYYGLVLSKASEQVRKQVLAAMEKHLYDAQKLSEEGQIAQVEKLHAEVAVAEAERELQKAARQSSMLERALQNTLALSETDSLVPVSKLFILRNTGDIHEYMALARTNSPLLRQVGSKKDLAETGLKAEKSNYLPTLALTGMYDIANKDLSPYMPGWMVGLGLNWTLFDGAARSQKIQAARFKIEQVNEAGQKADADIGTLIQKLHHELSMQAEQLVSLDKSLKFAQTYAESKEKAFSEGLSSSSELVDAQLLVARFRIERLQVMYQYDLALASLLQICGTPEQFAGYPLRDDVIFGSADEH
ncbi:TolC family protein [Gaoshiqia sp. Z1-71]|uniref:TolC family protein n=1 Tax=Gaoshiqia hydrogeniformans TaxID=3290090 RepID=UPI003BF87AC8